MHDQLVLPQQLTLDLQLREDATFGNFIVGANNKKLITHLKEITSGQGEFFTYVWGELGLGRSHLLQACCHHATEQEQFSVYIPFKMVHHFEPAIFENLERLSLVCLDDIDVIVTEARWAEALLHLYNRMKDANRHLIVTAKVAPTALQVKLLDLASRLQWGMAFAIQELTDEEKLAALQLRAHSRGILLNEEVGEFLLHRWPRNLAALFDAFDELDRVSLQLQRKITIPFVKKVLGL